MATSSCGYAVRVQRKNLLFIVVLYSYMKMMIVDPSPPKNPKQEQPEKDSARRFRTLKIDFDVPSFARIFPWESRLSMSPRGWHRIL